MSATINRKRLAALLEEYGGSLASFNKLRPDSYEHALAASSLERLEQFYSEIFKPGQSAEQAREKCPAWPPATKRAGELPTATLINTVCERFNTEATLNGLGPVQAFLEQYRKSVQATPLGDNNTTTDAIIALCGQELIKAKQQGIPVTAQLKAVGALQYQKALGLKATELALSRDKFQFDAAKACLKVLPQLKKIASDKTLDENGKINAAREQLFGQLAE